MGGLGGFPPLPPPGTAGESATPPFARMRESTSRYDAPDGNPSRTSLYKASSLPGSYPLSFASPHVGTGSQSQWLWYVLPSPPLAVNRDPSARLEAKTPDE